MSWGWIGTAIGFGGAVLATILTGGVATLPIALMVGAGGAIAGAGVGSMVGKAVEKFGDTPKNELTQLGVDPNKLHEEAMKYREKREDFLKEKNKEDLEAIGNLEKKLNSLDETIKNLSTETAKMDDGDPEKPAKLAQLNNTKKERDEVQQEIDKRSGRVEDRNNRLDELFKKAGDPTHYTATQYKEKANTPFWKSYKNWGIGIAGVIIFFILIGFIKKLFNGILSSIKG